MKKTFEDCKKEVAQKYGFKNLVMGHLAKYWQEAGELYSKYQNEYLVFQSDYQQNVINVQSKEIINSYKSKDEFLIEIKNILKNHDIPIPVRLKIVNEIQKYETIK